MCSITIENDVRIRIPGNGKYTATLVQDSNVKTVLRLTAPRSQILFAVKWGAEATRAHTMYSNLATFAPDSDLVPDVIASKIETVKGVKVFTCQREYRDGVALSELIDRMNPVEIYHVSQTAGAALNSISIGRSGMPYSGDRETMMTAFKRFVADTLPATQCHAQAYPDSLASLPASVCHMDLHPEHVIVERGSVVSIVGWSEARMLSPEFERIKYYFMASCTVHSQWYLSLAKTDPPRGNPVPRSAVCAYAEYWYRKIGIYGSKDERDDAAARLSLIVNRVSGMKWCDDIPYE